MKRFAIALLISVALLSACASSKWTRTTIDKQYEHIVSLEQHQDEVPQQQVRAHELNIADLKKLMGDLQYTEPAGLMKKNKQSPVFQQTEIERLAPLFVDALAKAGAGQRIRFISFNQDEGLVFSVSRKTEGVIFIDLDGQLNLAFNYINANRLTSETSALYASYSNIDPVNITTSDITISSPPAYAELHKFATGKPAPLWVVADLAKLKETISTVTLPTVKTAEQSPLESAPKTGAIASPAEKTAPAIATEASLQADLQQDIKNKLKYLKELLDEGLISEKDYTAKKAELLDKIR